MKKVFFSIIVPIYNVDKYLSECLDSIMIQKYQNFEVICVNDASTDGSYKMLMEYASKSEKIRVINNKVNGGLSYSRNRGMEIAKGDYLYFVDSDDYLRADALSIIADIVMKFSVDILNFNYDVIYEGARRAEKKIITHEKYQRNLTCITGQEWFVNAFGNNSRSPMYVNVWTKVYRRKFLDEGKIKFYEGILFEDILFFLQSILKAKKVYFIEDSLYTYRKRDGSITAVINEKQLDSYVIILSEIYFLWKSSELETGMDEAIKNYMNQRILPSIRTLMMYFPNHKEIKIGNPEDQFLFSLLQDFDINCIKQYVDFNQEELDIIKGYDKRIIYGAGVVCSELIIYLKKQKINIFSIAVSNRRSNIKKIAGYAIQQIDDLIEYRKEALVIVAVVKKDQEPICQKLAALGFENTLLIDTDRVKKQLI